MTSLTFHLTADCPECGCRLRGFQMAWGCRINKRSIRTGRSLVMHGDCPECGFKDPRGQMQPWSARLDKDSELRVATARERLSTRRRP